MDLISKLFGNESRVKLMRFLLLNDTKFYTLGELEKKTGVLKRSLQKEIEHLTKSGLVKIKKTVEKPVARVKSKKKIHNLAVSLRNDFKHLVPLKNLFVATTPLSTDLILKRISQTGRVKLVVTSGIFMETPESRLDLLIVGDRLDKKLIDRVMRSFEMTLGRDLRYAHLETSDFNYRLSIFDRLVRDVLDYPHQKILNKIGL